MDRQLLVKCLKEEIVETTGCTDPGCVALAAAKAASLVEGLPVRAELLISQNVYKNGIGVGIPNTNGTGLYLAAAIGLELRDHADLGLSLMEKVTETTFAQANARVRKGTIEIEIPEEAPDPLYVRAEVFDGVGNSAVAVIAHDYDCFIKIERNGEQILSREIPSDAESSVEQLLSYRVEEIIEDIRMGDWHDFAFLVECAEVNEQSLAKCRGMFDLAEQLPVVRNLPQPFQMMHVAKENTFLLAKARMLGKKIPVIAVTGSGNHGITNFIGVLAVADALGVRGDTEQLVRALAISTAVVVYIKGYIKRMTAFCGCTVAASTGVCAATAYLLGGDYEDMENAMNSLICSLCGILCDGAKESCAYKLSTGVSTAIEYAYNVVRKGFRAPKINGILSGTLEKTFAAMGYINNPGMRETDRALVRIVEKNYAR